MSDASQHLHYAVTATSAGASPTLDELVTLAQSEKHISFTLTSSLTSNGDQSSSATAGTHVQECELTTAFQPLALGIVQLKKDIEDFQVTDPAMEIILRALDYVPIEYALFRVRRAWFFRIGRGNAVYNKIARGENACPNSVLALSRIDDIRVIRPTATPYGGHLNGHDVTHTTQQDYEIYTWDAWKVCLTWLCHATGCDDCSNLQNAFRQALSKTPMDDHGTLQQSWGTAAANTLDIVTGGAVQHLDAEEKRMAAGLVVALYRVVLSRYTHHTGGDSDRIVNDITSSLSGICGVGLADR